MISGRQQGSGVIVATFLVALLLTVVPLPDWLRPARPDWVGLVLIYWCLALPERVGVIIHCLRQRLADYAHRFGVLAIEPCERPTGQHGNV